MPQVWAAECFYGEVDSVPVNVHGLDSGLLRFDAHLHRMEKVSSGCEIFPTTQTLGCAINDISL